MTFEKKTGMTGIFTEHELELVKTFTDNGDRTPFIGRLFELGIFCQGAEGVLCSGLEHKIQPAPYALHIDSTTYCPLHCPQCYKGAAGDAYLSLSVFRKIIAEAEELHVFQIALGGGEPLSHPDLVEMVGVAAATEMSVTLTTSGFGLTEPRLRELMEAGINHIQVSLNGSTKEIHTCSRDGFEEAIQALTILAAHGCSFGVNWVARRDNLDDFPAMAAYAGKLGADNINVLRYKPSPMEPYEMVALNMEEFYRLVGKIRLVRGVTVKTDSAYSKLLVYLNHGQVSQNSCGCGAGRSFVAVTAEGHFKPCSHLKIPHWMGSRSVGEYLKSEQLRVFLETPFQDGDCAGCSYKAVCRGCRAICHSIAGNLFTGEADCPVFRQIKG